MEEIIEHLLGNQATTAPFLFPNLVRKTSSNPTPHQLCLIPFIQIPIPISAKMGDFPLMHPAKFYFFSVCGEHIIP
jgi:hypothetical protein